MKVVNNRSTLKLLRLDTSKVCDWRGFLKSHLSKLERWASATERTGSDFQQSTVEGWI